ncbi:MAG: clostripain-related cysteine peptidase [candidate division WOR-3 bacterium]|nr:clostripain-related cysteine peptidase [candidate division WOR-3 bacterium]
MPLRPFVLLVLSVLFLPAFAAQWTVGVYMCADNGMNDQADIDIAEMQQVGSTEEVNVVVQVDRAARDPRHGCYRYFIKKDGADTLAGLGDVDMADPTTLAGFADFLRRRYPATNYVLILWDHGNGWYSGYRASAIFIDESHGHEMGVAGGEFAQAMAGVKQSLGKRVRILAFDACLMGMVEVAAEVRDDCDYMLGSEALVPTDGLRYDKFLDRLTSRPTRTPAELLPDVCRDYVEQYPGEEVTLSALDMRGVDHAIGLTKTTLSDSVGPSNAELRAARASVQTMPGWPFHVDLIHFFGLLAGTFPDSLLASFRSVVIANERSSGLENASGLAIWFPGNYLALKGSIASYMTLGFAGESGWPQFLNRYFGADDVKPGQPAITKVRQGSRSDSRLWWNSCFDLAPVRYNLYEATRPEEVFNDNGDDFSKWINLGWTTSTQQAHSGQTSFFSGSANNLSNFIESAEALSLPAGGLLSFYAWHATKEGLDSLGGFTRYICYVEWSPDRGTWHALDSLYGDRQVWHERRYRLPAAPRVYLRFRYVTGASIYGRGVFLDDMKVYAFDTLRTVAEGIPDTTAAVFGVPRDTFGYSYFVTATDSFGNVSMASQFHSVAVKTWAEPYTRPAPFAGACDLVLDFPAGQTPEVLIYTLSGTLVRRFNAVSQHVLAWDGTNASGKALADGLYLVVVQGHDFKKLGKIAKVAGP